MAVMQLVVKRSHPLVRLASVLSMGIVKCRPRAFVITV